jgi:streptogramin lyase
MFWLVVAILAVAAVRAFNPRGGFDEIRTGEQPLEVAGADGGVWVLNFADHSVSLIDPSTDEVVQTTELDDTLAPALSANGDGAWVLLDGGATLARIDPAGGVADRIEVREALGHPAQDLSAGDGFVWLTAGEGGQMVRVESDGTFDEAVDLGESVAQPQVLDDVLWVHETEGLAEFDVESGEQLRVVETTRRVKDFAVDDNALYLLADVDNFEQTGLVVRLDLEDGTETPYRITESRMSHVAVAGEQLFVSGSQGMLFELSTDPLRLVAEEQVAVSTKDLRGTIVHDGVVWVADGTNGVAFQPVDGIDGTITTTTLPG